MRHASPTQVLTGAMPWVRAVRLYRQGNQKGWLRAISDQPTLCTAGFGKVRPALPSSAGGGGTASGCSACEAPLFYRGHVACEGGRSAPHIAFQAGWALRCCRLPLAPGACSAAPLPPPRPHAQTFLPVPSQLEKAMKALRLRRLILWPRFHELVQQDLEASPAEVGPGPRPRRDARPHQGAPHAASMRAAFNVPCSHCVSDAGS
jgi:hypothetical protein